MSKALSEYLSPKHKVLEFLKKGHDALRAKYADLMVKLRRSENQVRAVTKVVRAGRSGPKLPKQNCVR